MTATQQAYLQTEKAWVAFGEANDVRVVIMRVADRVYGPKASAMARISKGQRPEPCRVVQCAEDEPLTRIHVEDLTKSLLRMLSMFDIVDTHGTDSSMRGTASMESSIARFPTGSILEVVDDGPADSMQAAELWANAMMGAPLGQLCEGSTTVATSKDPTGHRAAVNRNAKLKDALGMPNLLYSTYRHGAAKLFGKGEF